MGSDIMMKMSIKTTNNKKIKRIANKTKDPEVLRKIFKTQTDLEFKTQTDLDILYAVVDNSKCPADILVKLLDNGEITELTNRAAGNPNGPVEILTKILNTGLDNNISWYAAYNPNCPPQALAKVLDRGANDVLSWVCAQNENTPPEALIRVLERGIGYSVCMYAVKNRSCPPEAVIKWYIKIGRRKKYDPSLHEVTPSKNNDLKILESLLDI